MSRQSPVAFGNFTPDFLDRLALDLAGKRVLEIYGGNGYFSSELAKRGVNIRSTSLFSGHDGHTEKMWGPVEEMDAVKAVMTYGDDYDILLVSWPTTTEEMFRAALVWGNDKDIFFIGERRRNNTWGAYPGCASDNFFDIITVKRSLDYYTPRNMLDDACVMRVK